MILGPISWLDCIVFVICLAPQLLIHINIFSLLLCVLQTLPFLFLELPFGFVYDHFALPVASRSPFVQQASWFEDFVIRCVRYAFANIPASIGRVFFSKPVALPFLRFRMLRHGYLRSPIHWHELNKEGFRGLWMINDPKRDPDIVVYYAHGGGFSMGSSYFYLEFLLAFLTLLKARTKYHNPAILAVEYALVPDASYPTQLHQIIAGYQHAVSRVPSASRIVVSGDSAGGTLILSLLLHLRNHRSDSASEKLASANGHGINGSDAPHMLPGMAALISPWTTLLSPSHHNTRSDYLDKTQLDHYAAQYISHHLSADDPLLSPGSCTDASWWRDAAPVHGFFFTYGAEEVLAPEIRRLVRTLEGAGVRVESQEEEGGIHAWPVASLFLSESGEKRLRGLEEIVRQIGRRMGEEVVSAEKI